MSTEEKFQRDQYIIATEAKKGVLRWAIGSPEEPRSATWRFWCNKKGDFYLSMQSAGGMLKASFHSDGNCHIGHTSDHWKKKMLENAGRHWNKWKLTTESAGRAMQILIPTSELRLFEEKPPKQISWIPSAPCYSMIVVTIFISAKHEGEPWPAHSEGALPIGVMNAGGRIVWIVYMEQHVPEQFAEFILKGRGIVANLPGAQEVLKTPEPRGCICGRNDGSESNFMLEVASPTSSLDVKTYETE